MLLQSIIVSESLSELDRNVISLQNITNKHILERWMTQNNMIKSNLTLLSFMLSNSLYYY